MFWSNSKISKSLPARLACGVYHFGQYGLSWKLHMIFLCKLTIVIPRLPSHFTIAKAVSLTFEQVNSVTSDAVDSFMIAM
jgi:hypothetical protein